MHLANQLTSIKLSKLTIRRRNWNNSLGGTIFQKYYTSILLAKGIVKMKVPNILALFDVLRLELPVVTKATEELKSSQLVPNNIAEWLYRRPIIINAEFWLSRSVCSG